MTPKEILTEDVKGAIKEDCLVDTSKERCGFVLKDLTVVPVENIAEEPVDGFIPKQEDFDEYEFDITAIYHSHNGEDIPGYLSLRDIQQSRYFQIPYVVYHTDFGAWDMFDPNYPHPYPLMEKEELVGTVENLLGIPFEWARWDCASAIRAYSETILGYKMKDYPRPIDTKHNRPGLWFLKESKNSDTGIYYEHLLKEEGLDLINTDQPRKGDVVIMRSFGSRVGNHTGVMVDKNKIFHVMEPGHKSEITVVEFPNSKLGSLHSVFRLKK